MIAILDNFINALTLQMGFILGDMIHVLHTFPGAIMTIALLIFFECLIIEGIIKDVRMAFKYVKNHKSKIIPVTSFLAKVPDVIFKNKNIVIKQVSAVNAIGIKYIKMNNWFN